MTCHAAIVTRELGVPCIVGARHATTTLRDGEQVTVDGTEGAVFEADPTPAVTTVVEREPAPILRATEALATKIYVNLAMAEHAAAVAAQPAPFG